MLKIEFKLYDTEEERSSHLVRIDVIDDRVWIGAEGFGDHASTDGNGYPFCFDFQEGKPFLTVWGDINQEDPTHRIDLTNAMESKREDAS